MTTTVASGPALELGRVKNLLDPGPYMNEDGDWWVPVNAMSYLDARRLVRMHIHADPEDTRLSYEGREMVWLDEEHEAGEREYAFYVNAWHFREIERWRER